MRIDTRLTWQTIPPGQFNETSIEKGIKKHQAAEYHFDFLNFGGLLRSVWLLSLSELHLTAFHLYHTRR